MGFSGTCCGAGEEHAPTSVGFHTGASFQINFLVVALVFLFQKHHGYWWNFGCNFLIPGTPALSPTEDPLRIVSTDKPQLATSFEVLEGEEVDV